MIKSELRVWKFILAILGNFQLTLTLCPYMMFWLT